MELTRAGSPADADGQAAGRRRLPEQAGDAPGSMGPPANAQERKETIAGCPRSAPLIPARLAYRVGTTDSSIVLTSSEGTLLTLAWIQLVMNVSSSGRTFHS